LPFHDLKLSSVRSFVSNYFILTKSVQNIQGTLSLLGELFGVENARIAAFRDGRWVCPAQNPPVIISRAKLNSRENANYAGVFEENVNYTEISRKDFNGLKLSLFTLLRMPKIKQHMCTL
jgi:hypothetical protein